MPSGTLFVVATPIGNLADITLRALETLKSVDLIVAEDSRVTQKLLNHYNIAKKVISYHQHSKLVRVEGIVSDLEAGKNIALVTDAGTPGISDPGNFLVAKAVEKNISVVPIPGSSALGALVSVAGIDLQRFLFLGFPPHKKGRETFFKEVAAAVYPVVYYESPHRALKSLASLQQFAGNKKVIVGRELTKQFEETFRGSAAEAEQYFITNPDKVRGEFAIIVY
ncbi:16S rRNA (cytidine(1402)-2'-O)-methyltransferase [Patescibacteria group bacterium]|nr:MAG: 16S rRNA (cytidine(1402)-2'-O)-methyltransferase [Patescibacteria group bacterium]